MTGGSAMARRIKVETSSGNEFTDLCIDGGDVLQTRGLI